MLAKTGRAAVFQAALHARLLKRCLAVLMAPTWSSVLHNALLAVVLEFVSNREQGLHVVLSLLDDGPLMRRIVAELGQAALARAELAATLELEDAEASVGLGASAAAPRAGVRGRSTLQMGHIGHLRSICASLCEFGGRAAEVADALARVEGWSEVVLPEVEAMDKLQSEALGGPPPCVSNGAEDGFDCLLAACANVDDLIEECDLSMEDLRDINEEYDAQQFLDIVGEHKRR